ncbi:MAG: oxygen-independent coproporphyrinogen III oxidase [Clostridiales bacterium]|nr:oxygen-independent coproporphyrinogen III oxidase [Clostridiales bacterium]
MDQDYPTIDRASKDHEKRRLGLYIHIPFCIRKCDYCDFLSAPATDTMKKRYVEALLTEIKSYHGKMEDYLVSTIFFGGGTPSAIDAYYIEEIINAIHDSFPMDHQELEISIEVNPGSISKEKFQTYKRAGINRLSFGLQSTDNKELKILGRIHTYEDFLGNFKLAREVGFDNINVDLMSALPKQTLKSWEDTLNKVAELEPEHISAYSLIIEEGTPFYHLYREGGSYRRDLPDEETDRRIYHRTKEILKEYGYYRYEISNYSKPGYECKHNLSYWIGREYLGLGLGSSSLLNGTRFHNIQDINNYLQITLEGASGSKLLGALREDYKQLSIEEKMEEFMFLGLRMTDGVSREEFKRRFQVNIDQIYQEQINTLINHKLLQGKGDRIYLTDYGLDISNLVLEQFLLN